MSQNPYQGPSAAQITETLMRTGIADYKRMDIYPYMDSLGDNSIASFLQACITVENSIPLDTEMGKVVHYLVAHTRGAKAPIPDAKTMEQAISQMQATADAFAAQCDPEKVIDGLARSIHRLECAKEAIMEYNMYGNNGSGVITGELKKRIDHALATEGVELAANILKDDPKFQTSSRISEDAIDKATQIAPVVMAGAQVRQRVWQTITDATICLSHALEGERQLAAIAPSAPLMRAQEKARSFLNTPLHEIIHDTDLHELFCDTHELNPKTATIGNVLKDYMLCEEHKDINSLKPLFELAEEGKRPTPKQMQAATTTLMHLDLRDTGDLNEAIHNMDQLSDGIVVPTKNVIEFTEAQGIATDAGAHAAFNRYCVAKAQDICKTLGIQQVGGRAHGVN